MRKPHVILVAFSVRPIDDEPNTREQARTQLMSELEKVTIEGDFNIECWWEAEDDRGSNADEDSAVFVVPGRQADASQLLYLHGMTPTHNVLYDRAITSESRRKNKFI